LVFIKSARDIKRFEGISKFDFVYSIANSFTIHPLPARSPVYSHVSNTFNGLASIRAFGAQKTFERQFCGYQNDHTSTWFFFISTSRMMGIAMEAICATYILIITIAVMFTDSKCNV